VLSNHLDAVFSRGYNSKYQVLLKSKTVTSPVTRHRDEIAELCRRYRVQRLELFGSAASGEFNPQTSDLDFLVLFEELEPVAYADAYLGFYESLTALFDHPVELLSSAAITNPYFLESIQRNLKTLYAA